METLSYVAARQPGASLELVRHDGLVTVHGQRIPCSVAAGPAQRSAGACGSVVRLRVPAARKAAWQRQSCRMFEGNHRARALAKAPSARRVFGVNFAADGATPDDFAALRAWHAGNDRLNRRRPDRRRNASAGLGSVQAGVPPRRRRLQERQGAARAAAPSKSSKGSSSGGGKSACGGWELIGGAWRLP